MVKLDPANNSNNNFTDNINSNNQAAAKTGASARVSNYSRPTANLTSVTREPVSKSPAYIQKSKKVSWWGRLSLGTKATVLAVALGVLPVLGIGIADYVFVRQALNSENGENEEGYSLRGTDQPADQSGQ